MRLEAYDAFSYSPQGLFTLIIALLIFEKDTVKSLGVVDVEPFTLQPMDMSISYTDAIQMNSLTPSMAGKRETRPYLRATSVR